MKKLDSLESGEICRCNGKYYVVIADRNCKYYEPIEKPNNITPIEVDDAEDLA